METYLKDVSNQILAYKSSFLYFEMDSYPVISMVMNQVVKQLFHLSHIFNDNMILIYEYIDGVTYPFRNKILQPPIWEKSRVIHKMTKIVNKTIIVPCCQFIGPNASYCCFRIDLIWFWVSSLFESTSLHGNSSWRLYNNCNQSQHKTIKIRLIGKANKVKLANDISKASELSA